MATSKSPPFKIGRFWLGRKTDRPTWYRYWWDAEYQRTRRASLRTKDFEEAKERLIEFYLASRDIRDEDPRNVFLADVLRRYYEQHCMHVRSHDAIRIALEHWVEFF